MLVSLANMKSYLGLAGNTYDTFLTLQLNLVSEAIEGYCRRSFIQDTYTETFYRKDFTKAPVALDLYHTPVVSIASITEFVTDGDDQVIEDYTLHKPTGRIDFRGERTYGAFTPGFDYIEVEYTAGHLEADVPALIQNVVYSVVQERYNKKINGIDLNFGTDVQRISIPGTISIDFDYSLNNNERKSHFGQILGSHLNVLDAFRTERALVGTVRRTYVQ
jgi:hypothetical protein